MEFVYPPPPPPPVFQNGSDDEYWFYTDSARDADEWIRILNSARYAFKIENSVHTCNMYLYIYLCHILMFSLPFNVHSFLLFPPSLSLSSFSLSLEQL